LAQEIIEALVDGADGMCVLTFWSSNRFAKFNRFLWVDYQITEICECTCDDEVWEVLRTFPKNLRETFDRATPHLAAWIL
jgi:hypothetical protein